MDKKLREFLERDVAQNPLPDWMRELRKRPEQWRIHAPPRPHATGFGRGGAPSPSEDIIIMYPGQAWCHGCTIKYAIELARK